MRSFQFIICFLMILACGQLHSQAYEDYIGAGHNRDITVTSSDNWQQDNWSQTAAAENTINGAGMEGKLSEASRFLTQAAIGHDIEATEHVAEIGIEAWIDEQIAQPYSLYLPLIEDVMVERQADMDAVGDTSLLLPYEFIQKTAWWRMNMLERDFLRDKIALAWSEIMVISVNSPISPYGDGVMNYLDIFKSNAFGNYADILREVTLHPSMGIYLSHYGNPKGNPEQNLHPDENYAREIMQLFSIGLYELNNDGSRKLDADDHLIPTYNQNDIGEIAKIFTGLGAGGSRYESIEPAFNLPIWAIGFTTPMVMYEEHHETAEKNIFGSLNIPANQPGMTDVDTFLDYLFNHPNTGPFICNRLIQLLVKSNPTPAYIDRVATVFNGDESGVRGNMEAVMKAILLDEEARTCVWKNDPTQGKLKHATEKSIQFTRVVDIQSESNEIWTDAEYQSWTTTHIPLAAPSVFNFHETDYSPAGEIADAGLVAPEFQIFNTHTSIGYGNNIWRWFYLWEEYGHGNWRADEHKMHPILDSYLEASQDSEVLINMLDMRMTNGNLSAHTRNAIKTFLTEMDPDYFPLPDAHLDEYPIEKIKQVIILILLSPDFNILK